MGWRNQSGEDRKKYSSLGRKLPFMKSKEDGMGGGEDSGADHAESSNKQAEEDYVPTYEMVQQVSLAYKHVLNISGAAS